VERQLAGAWRVVAAYRTSDGAMIGYARAMSDGEASAYLADVFVVEEACGLGVGKTSPPPRIKVLVPTQRHRRTAGGWWLSAVTFP
jgi:hypothetical protein